MKNVRKRCAEPGREKQEQREYYARWVHQIKTPIAAMQLLLQTQREEAPERYKEQEEIEEQLFRIEQYVSMALQYQRKDSHDYVLHSIALDGIIRDSIHKYAENDDPQKDRYTVRGL